MEDVMTSESERCPKCGYPNVYIGAISIECGYIENCENYTSRQGKEVENFLREKFPSAADVTNLDWSQEEDKTDPC